MGGGSAFRLRFFDADANLVGDIVPPELNGSFGRLRGSELGPDGALYLTTDNGSLRDRILRVSALS